MAVREVKRWEPGTIFEPVLTDFKVNTPSRTHRVIRSHPIGGSPKVVGVIWRVMEVDSGARWEEFAFSLLL